MKPGKRIFLLLNALLVFAVSVNIQLPLDADIQCEDTTGKSWRQRGVNACSLSIAEKKWRMTLSRQNWICIDTFALSRKGEHLMSVWTRGKEKIILSLWRIDCGESGFAWGKHQDSTTRANKEK